MGHNYVVNICDLVSSTSTNDDGDKVFSYIYDYIKHNKKITLSFEGIYALNSSFVNSAFVELLDHFPLKQIQTNLVFVNSTKQINSLILKRFKEESISKQKAIAI